MLFRSDGEKDEEGNENQHSVATQSAKPSATSKVTPIASPVPSTSKKGESSESSESKSTPAPTPKTSSTGIASPKTESTKKSESSEKKKTESKAPSSSNDD